MYFRLNYWYMNVYILWVNTILNIFVPIVILVILNTLTFRSRGLTLFFTSLHPLSEGTLIHFEIYVQDLLCIHYLQETHRALPEPPGKHRDDKRDQCEPAPRGKVQTCHLHTVTLP